MVGEYLEANVDKDKRQTFACNSFWKAASDIDRWQQAIKYLEANVDKDKHIDQWQQAIKYLEANDKDKRQTFAQKRFSDEKKHTQKQEQK